MPMASESIQIRIDLPSDVLDRARQVLGRYGQTSNAAVVRMGFLAFLEGKSINDFDADPEQRAVDAEREADPG